MTDGLAGIDRLEAAMPSAGPHADVRGALGVIGGTFDPIHFGHLAIAEEARVELGLRRVLFMPAGRPPHKPGRPISPALDRVAMVELAIADNPGFALSRLEVDREGPSYTVETIERLCAQLADAGEPAEIVFILSAEALAGLPAWHEPDRLLSLCRLAVAPRPDHRMPDADWLEAHLPGRTDRVILLEGPRVCVSGSEIRRRAGQGRSIRYHLPTEVAAYVAAHRLYDSPARRNAIP